MELEDRLTLDQAEGIDLDLRLAGIASRGSALIVDLLIEFLVLLVVVAAGASLGDLGTAFAAVASFLILLGYPIVAEAFAGGRTLGKALFRLQVVGTQGQPITFLQATIRNLVRFVDSLPGVYLVGIVCVVLSKRAQRVGDLAAGTLVVHRPRPAAGAAWTVEVDPASIPGSWDVSAVSADEVAAVRSFLGRRADLAPQARYELAATLAGRLTPKVAGVPLDGGPEAFLERVAAARSVR